MITKFNLTILSLIIIFLIICHYSLKIKNSLTIKDKFKIYNKKLESNCFVPIKKIYDNKIFNINEKYNFEFNLRKKMSYLRWFEEEIINKKVFLTKSNCIKNMSIIFESYCTMINKVENSQILMKKSFEEFNDRITFYYRFINENNLFNFNYRGKKINIYKVSKHHHAVEWIYKNTKKNIGTILHIDSHADMNPIGNDIKFIKKCIDDSNFSFNNLKRIFDNVHEIGSVLVPMVSPYENNNGIIWITPDWVKEPFCKSDNKITTTYNICTFVGKCPIHYPIKMEKDLPMLDKVVFNEEDKKIKVITSNILYYKKILNDISDDYILNIDLDYFVTYGCDNYLPGGLDAISDNRTIFDYGLILKNPREGFKVKTSLDLEISFIRDRIDKFLQLIVKLRDMGKIPKTIIICDSTSVDFTNDQLGQEFMNKNATDLTNEFTPKFITFWLHNTIHRHLQEIFTN